MKNMESLHNAHKIKVVKGIHAEFKDILKNEKCRTCSCFYADVLNNILVKIKKFRKTEAAQDLARIENDFERWIKEAAFLKMHA